MQQQAAAYKVYRNNRVLKSVGTGFKDYEKARQALRKYIRRLVAKGKESKLAFGMWDCVSRNPTFVSHMGFEIKRTTH